MQAPEERQQNSDNRTLNRYQADPARAVLPPTCFQGAPGHNIQKRAVYKVANQAELTDHVKDLENVT